MNKENNTSKGYKDKIRKQIIILKQIFLNLRINKK